MPQDRFQKPVADMTAPAERPHSVAPSNTEDLPFISRGLMVTTAGDVRVTMKYGDPDTLPGLQPGVLYPFRVQKVFATGTTATGIKAFD